MKEVVELRRGKGHVCGAISPAVVCFLSHQEVACQDVVLLSEESFISW